MNAKKIMGAVLVALLAAALFVGAGAAAVTDGQTVFVNQKVEGLTGTWTSGSNSIVASDAGNNYGYFTGKIVEGVYVNGTGNNAISINVKYPAISVSGLANVGNVDAEYQFIPGTYYIGSNNVDVTVSPLAGASIEAIYLTIPGVGEVLVSSDDEIGDELEQTPAVGEYSIRVLYSAANFVNGTFYTDRISKPVTFTVAEEDAFSIAASVDQALPSDAFKVTITGQPGDEYTVTYNKDNAFSVAASQLGLPNVQTSAVNGFYPADGFTFEMPNNGQVEFTAKLGSAAKDSVKMTVANTDNKKQSVSIKVLKGTLSAKTDAASYFIGDIVKISGTSTAGDINLTALTLTGTNFIAENLIDDVERADKDTTATEWSFKLNTALIENEKPGFGGKMIDVGTYTLTIETENGVKATVPVVLKQPFISIVEAPEVIVKGDEAEFIINAEATENGIAYYIFGTNYFVNNTVDDAVDEETPNQYVIELEDTDTDKMDPGQYFMVIQHPMYDQVFNIQAVGKKICLMNEDGTASVSELFDVFERQTANAAQALCDALDTQNIDDMYVKYSFFVVGEDESFTISEIPATIAQGETLTISGVSTANAGEYVTVEMISTAFAAVPKETVGSAAFIAVTTQIADDGTWEVTFDTSNLNVDEYSLKVACAAEEKPWKNVNINVVEAADEPVTPPTDKPDEPVTPPQDDAPETPGFGALAALAGLGAVAVLLLRRE